MIEKYKNLLNEFVLQSKEILGDNLTGIYLHGSAVMECFQEKKSDLDLLVVVRDTIWKEQKRQYMEMVLALNARAPKKGLELSLIKETVCNPFVYPTPFELHFSNTHLEWYKRNPEDYIEKMNGNDKDLAAHIMITYYRGKTLYGKDIKQAFAKASQEIYFDSIWCDVEHAREDIVENPMYVILNLCRVRAYKEENLILSKKEGGAWGLQHIFDKRYRTLILSALTEYETGVDIEYDKNTAVKFAKEMVENIL